MPRRRDAAPRSGCPISIALELFGDPWSLLIVRDLMFKGVETFTGFQAAGEGVATNILADRLRRLEEGGILARSPDPEDARRVRYRLTRKGADLAPVLIEMVLWAARHERTDAPAAALREMRSHRARLIKRLQQPWQ